MVLSHNWHISSAIAKLSHCCSAVLTTVEHMLTKSKSGYCLAIKFNCSGNLSFMIGMILWLPLYMDNSLIIVDFCFRSQLTVIVSNIIKYDYPDKWPNVVTKIQLYLQGDNHRAWMGALLTLYQLVKNYEYVLSAFDWYSFCNAVLGWKTTVLLFKFS